MNPAKRKVESDPVSPGDSYQAAFFATEYRVSLNGQSYPLRLARCHPDFDAALQQFGCSEWAVVTACNPGAQALSGYENAARTAALLSDLAIRGWAAFPACNVADHCAWPDEPGVLLPGRSEDEARLLACAYGQLACVHGVVGQPARLVWSASSEQAVRPENS